MLPCSTRDGAALRSTPHGGKPSSTSQDESVFCHRAETNPEIVGDAGPLMAACTRPVCPLTGALPRTRVPLVGPRAGIYLFLINGPGPWLGAGINFRVDAEAKWVGFGF